MKKIASFILLFTCMQATRSTAQLSGVKTVPGDYATIAAAVSALNGQGVSSAVTIRVNAGHSETAPAGGIILGSAVLNSGAASLTASRTLTIQKNGSGANPLITAFTPGTGSTDGIFKITGADYVTIDGIDLRENSSNTTATQQMEWGYALLKLRNTAPFDGCSHVTVRNSVITLNKSNVHATGIYGGNHLAGDLTPLAITAAGDAHSDNIFSGNTIQNVRAGIELNGYDAPLGATALYDQNNIIGGSSGAEGNVIRNFGLASGVAGDIVSGIFIAGQNNARVEYNTINNLAGGGTFNANGALHGIYHGTARGSVVNIHNNTIVLEQDSLASKADFYPIRTAVDSGTAPAVFISGNTITATGGYGLGFAFIYQNGKLSREVLSDNIFKASRVNSWNFYIIRNNNAVLPGGSVSIRNNRLSDGLILRLTGGAGKAPIYYGIYNSGASDATSRDTIAGNILTGIFANMTTNNIFKPIYDNSGPAAAPYPAKFIYSNRFGDLDGAGTALQVNGIIASRLGRHTDGFSGIYDNIISNTRLNNGSAILIEAATGQTVDIYGNRIDSCGNNAGTVTAIKLAEADSVRIFDNIIRNISTSGSSSKISGIQVSAGLLTSIYNNMISGLETPASNANPAITGIELAGGAFQNIYHNTIYLNPAATSATAFGLAGISFNGTIIGLDIRNNIVNINAAAKGNGYVAALRRNAGVAGTVPSNLANTTNGNIWNVNNSRHSYLYAEGADTTTLTNAFAIDADFNTPCNGWKKFMSPAESNSFTEDNLAATGSPSVFTPSGPSYAKERAVALPVVQTDMSGISRPSRADAGALQFTGSAIPAPEAAFAQITAPSRNGFCAGDSMTLLTTVYPGMSYQWQKNGTDIPGATDTLLSISTPGSYAVVASSGQCADTSPAVTIAEYPLPVPVITANGFELSTGTGYASWQWYFNDTLISQATGATHTAVNPGNYTVAVTDSNGCTGMSAVKEVEQGSGIRNHAGAGTPDIRVYPNPVSGKVYIAAPFAGRVNLSLRNLSGQQLLSKDRAAEMDISMLAPGIYILMITDGSGSLMQMKKIVKEQL